MPVPKRKRSHSRKSKRNANKNFSIKAFTFCSNCKEVVRPHTACKGCGHYKGIKILVTKTERAMARGTARKAIIERQKAMQAQQAEAVQEKE